MDGTGYRPTYVRLNWWLILAAAIVTMAVIWLVAMHVREDRAHEREHVCKVQPAYCYD